MKTTSLRSLTLAAAAFLASALHALAGDPSGTWKFQAEGPGGRKVDATLTLHWQNNQLSGVVDNRAGDAKITDATFANDEVAFTVVREVGRRFRKQKITSRYTAKLEGDTLKGTIHVTAKDEKSTTLPWEAKRVKP